jgi:hypothetical protein
LYQLTCALAYRDYELCGKSLLHQREPAPLIQGFLHICAGQAIGVRVSDVYTGGWIDDHEDRPGMENIRRKNCPVFILGGSKSRGKDDCSDCEEFAKRHSGPPPTRQVYTSPTDDDDAD